MYRRYQIFAIIPARGGSKGIPKKNIRLLNGKPLITWSIDCAQSCGFFDEIFVSTDSQEIVKVAQSSHVSILQRPPELATDTASGTDVFINSIMSIAQKASVGTDSFFLYLQPTSPLRSPEDIRNALNIAVEKGADSVVSVCECEHHPFLCNTLPPDLSMASFLKPGTEGKNRQELPKYYRLNGAIYILRGRSNYNDISIFSGAVYASIMPQNRSIDIDSTIDFQLAEILMKSRE